MTSTPSDVVALRVRAVRHERGWNAEELASACQARGFSDFTASVIANIESGRRQDGRRRRDVTVDEVLQLADALSVPPLFLMLPWTGSGEAALRPGTDVSNLKFYNWLVGVEPLTALDGPDLTAWRRGVHGLTALRDYQAALSAARKEFRLVTLADAANSPKDLLEARKRHYNAYNLLAKAAETMMAEGQRLPPPPADEVGNLPMGITWPGTTGDPE